MRATKSALILTAALVLLGGCRPKDDGTITSTGTIEMTAIAISARTGGTIHRIPIEEGQPVQAGQLLAELDHAEIDAQLASARAALDVARLRESQARTSYQLTREQLTAQTRQAEANQEAAHQRALMVAGGARAQELEIARNGADQAQAQLDLAAKNLQRQQALLTQGLIPQAQFDQALAQKQVAEAGYQSAVNHLRLVQAGSRQEEIAIAESQDRQAQAGLELARANEKQIQLCHDEIALAAAQARQAEAAVSLLETQLAQCRILAPAAGIIAVRAAEPGENVGPGATLFSLLDIKRPWLKVFLPLTQVERVSVGDRVRVTLDAFPGRSFPGRVTYIASEAEFTPRNFQTKEERIKQVFAVKILVLERTGLLKSGMPADAVILPARVR